MCTYIPEGNDIWRKKLSLRPNEEGSGEVAQRDTLLRFIGLLLGIVPSLPSSFSYVPRMLKVSGLEFFIIVFLSPNVEV